MAKKSRPRKLSVYLYIPNIIGYIRVLLNCFAFYICSSNKQLFSVLYFISFVKWLSGNWFCLISALSVMPWMVGLLANLIKMSHLISPPLFSTFGAVLDMVTDRISTACLLVILSQVYRPGLVFLSLLALDIGSHWFQMYSTFLAGKASHKDVKDSTNWLFKAYYGNRIFMCYCCVACELLYITLFLLAKDHNENLTEVVAEASKQNSALAVLLALLLVGWAIKQAVNFIQMKTAADLCVDYDINKKQKA
ncbi:hypothetical protein RHGRI_013391 [Rhododendron griersonianum]|uniref:CDP-diacylglycerol--inositol 3-phosphatidyltransferase n=1 Tax=Rhododendron griersonianum TaxID=479676 RepID=A0AAV6K5U5_9ERIC|nr:hypothetical protein RHGRI_013391 [Rhododendron griersonianum]